MQLARLGNVLKNKSIHETGVVSSYSVAPVIFVVDDDRILGTSMRRFFESRQLSVAFFEDPRSFLDHLPRNPHGCVLLDVNMGELSGFEVMKELKRRGCKLPIIFVSGDTNVSTVVEAMKAGAFHFFRKPADLDELFATVLQAIESDQDRHEHRAQRQTLLERAALLTPREMHVARLVAAGMLNKQVASELGIAEKTVKVHRGRVVEKLQVGSVADLVRFMDAIDGDDEPNTDNDS